MTALDDGQLLRRAQALDGDALALVHDTYYPQIYRYIALRVRDRALAEDLSSEVFTRLLSALHEGRAPRSSVRGWLFGVAARVVADQLRRRYRRDPLPWESLDREPASDEGDPDRELVARMAREGLLEAMDALTDEQRDVLVMRFGAGLPIRAVAEAMGKSEGAVKQLQLRAVARLGRLMADRSGEWPGEATT